MFVEKIKLNKNYIELIGEYSSYMYILSIFLNSKLNMKLGYVILGLAILNIIFFPKKILKVNKKVYGVFLIIFVLGIIWNYFGSNGSGIEKFIKENEKFLYGVALMILLNLKNKDKISASIFLGTNILSFGYLYYNFSWLLDNDITRQRGILFLGSIYLLIYSFEKIIENRKNILFLLTLIFPILALIKSNSRMAGIAIIIILFLYGIYKILKDKKNIKIIFVIFLGFFLLSRYIPQNYIKQLETSFHLKNNLSNEDRIVMWKAGIHIFKENIILGVGNDSEDIKPLVQKYVDENVNDMDLRNEFLLYPRFSRLHNMYIDFFVQNGILGFLFLFYLFYIIPKEINLKFKLTKETLSCIFVMIAFYLYGLTWSLWSGYGIVRTLFECILAIFLINNCNLFEEK